MLDKTELPILYFRAPSEVNEFVLPSPTELITHSSVDCCKTPAVPLLLKFKFGREMLMYETPAKLSEYGAV